MFDAIVNITSGALSVSERPFQSNSFSASGFVGAPSETRTRDPLIKSQLLYQLS